MFLARQVRRRKRDQEDRWSATDSSLRGLEKGRGGGRYGKAKVGICHMADGHCCPGPTPGPTALVGFARKPARGQNQGNGRGNGAGGTGLTIWGGGTSYSARAEISANSTMGENGGKAEVFLSPPSSPLWIPTHGKGLHFRKKTINKCDVIIMQ